MNILLWAVYMFGAVEIFILILIVIVRYLLLPLKVFFAASVNVLNNYYVYTEQENFIASEQNSKDRYNCDILPLAFKIRLLSRVQYIYH